MSAIAAALRELPARQRLACEARGWAALTAAAEHYPALARWRAGGQDGLPLFDLAASLTGPGGLGNAALRLLFLPQDGKSLTRPEWWSELLDGLRTWRRRPDWENPEDRRDVALALVAASLDQLAVAERRAFWGALHNARERFPEWQLANEFGVA